MSEEDIRHYLNSQAGSTKTAAKQPRMVVRRPRRAPAAPTPEAQAPEGYQDFSATHLFCPTCRQAMPVRERILLFLSDGDLYQYTCTQCGTGLGTRKAGK